MSDPVFHLSGIVRSRGETEDFEGPLSLILLLLSKNRIEIRDIKISLILDQYMEYLRRMEEMDLEVASEFVAMASHLAYIKSRMLVAPEGEEISELEELIQGLERLRRKDDYEKIRAVTGQLERMYRKGAGFIEKPPEPLPSSRDYRYRHEPEQLIQAMTELLSREDRIAEAERALAGRYPQKVMFPVERKAEEILEKLRAYGTVSLAGLFYSCGSRSEMVAVFISVLEMCKTGVILLSGGNDDVALSLTGADASVSFSGYEDGE